jgi:hypothetical protein
MWKALGNGRGFRERLDDGTLAGPLYSIASVAPASVARGECRTDSPTGKQSEGRSTEDGRELRRA